MDKHPDKFKKLKRGQKTAFAAAFITLLLAITKGLVGYFYDSKILIADAFHGGADLLAISASGFGLWLASRKKTTKFPYGLYKAETFVSLIIGALIVWAGVEILKDGIHKFFHIAQTNVFPALPVAVSVISIILAFFIAKRERHVGKAINSQSLIANANESFLDIFTSLVVLAGILLAYRRIPHIEGAIIILISLLIFKLGIENIRTSLLALLDANLSPEMQSSITEQVNKIYGVRGVSEVNIRQSGPFQMVECKIMTSPELALYKAHGLADEVERYVTRNYENVESVFIHVEPVKEKAILAIIPVKEINGLDSEVHDHFGRAPYFLILRLDGENIDIEDFYYNEFIGEKKHIGVKVIRAVIKYKLDMLFTSQIGEISFHMLKDNFVDIYSIEEGITARDAITKYRKGKLKAVTAPTHLVEEAESTRS
jgi:cation diffusion facilitator family transporter